MRHTERHTKLCVSHFDKNTREKLVCLSTWLGSMSLENVTNHESRITNRESRITNHISICLVSMSHENVTSHESRITNRYDSCQCLRRMSRITNRESRINMTRANVSRECHESRITLVDIEVKRPQCVGGYLCVNVNRETTSISTNVAKDSWQVSQRLNVLCSSVLRCALQCVAVCCSVLQCVAVCCSVLQCVAVRCGVLWHSHKSANH